MKFVQWGNESSDASGPLFHIGYFIDEPTKGALNDGLRATVYIGLGFLIGNRTAGMNPGSPLLLVSSM